MPSNKKLLQAAAGNAGESLYVEDVFSTYLYEGTGSDRSVTNGIDLDGEGGLVWIKNRDRSSGTDHVLFDTERGTNKELHSNNTDAEDTAGSSLSAFNSDGFDIDGFADNLNSSDSGANKYASFTFRKAEKFFTALTYTGNSVNGRQLPHNLGSTPGMVVCKRTDTGQNWILQHRSLDLSSNKTMFLNSTDALAVANDYWNSTHASDTAITLSGNADINGTGGTYVAYVFAHDAGGFGDDDESIIKCGSYTGNGSTDGPEIDLGFEAQWVMIKRTDASGNDWVMMDIMRGMPADSGGAYLRANLSNDEAATAYMQPTPTGLKVRGTGSTQANASGGNYIYIAIRRPMKTPESGTEVFKANYVDNGASFPDMLSGFPVDMYFRRYVNTTNNPYWFTRLLGTKVLDSSTTGAEQSFSANSTAMDSNVGVMNIFSTNNTDFYGWMFKRATGFMDAVAYSGSGSATTQTHNLGAVPELMIVKQRSGSGESWTVWNKTIAASNSAATLWLNSTSAVNNFSNRFNSTAPTDSVFSVAGDTSTNGSGSTYIAYLFATLDGVSKVGSYTGTGSNVDVDCGFSAGARFILIKRTDSTGDWYVWDSERGIVAGNDPYLLLNSTAAEVTNTDYIDPLNAGFTVTSSASSTVNVSSGTYIFLAIA